MPPREKKTTRLPKTLREELNDSVGNFHYPPKKWQVQVSRREVRKQERAVRKQNKADFFSTRHKRPAEEDHEESPRQKRPKYDESEASVISGPPLHAVPEISKNQTLHKKSLSTSVSRNAIKPRDKLVGGSDRNQAPNVKIGKEEEEDSYIAYLESKLGYTKGMEKSIMEDDGLDDLLDLTSSLEQTRNYDSKTSDALESENTGNSEDDVFEEWSGIEEQVSDSGSDGEPDTDNTTNDAHIATPSEQPQAITRYVPPHFRHVQQENQEDVIKLTRQLKGLLNRMSEQNMGVILDNIEEVYRNHKRNDVTSTLTKLIIGGIASHSSLLDSYVVMYAAFVASLHRIVGTEFAAYFVQNGVSLYERCYADLFINVSKSGSAVGGMGKECANLIVLLSELYNFQVISSVLVFDIIKGLLAGVLTEYSVDLLLKIVRNSGQQLRQDDPSALKNIVQIVQGKADNSENLSPRTRFMIETLTNLKNNKLKRNLTQNQGGESVERMKNFLAGLAKTRHLLAHEPLRVSLEDLHSSETKGKWWLVGAAWNGNPLLDRQKTRDIQRTINEIDNDSLIKLARKQGMNTDIRQSIFVVLMSSDDYVDACERLSQLTLNEVQQREIVRVILHCCGNEKSYNPYYTLVCQHLCHTSHSHKITLQFCLWDFFRDLGETLVGDAESHRNDSFELKKILNTRVNNMAKAYGWWIAKGCVTLTILKPMDFTDLKPQSRIFLWELLKQTFIGSQVITPMFDTISTQLPPTRNREAVEQVFLKATRIQPLAVGLIHFMSEAFQELFEDEGNNAELITWAHTIGVDTLKTGVDVVPDL